MANNPDIYNAVIAGATGGAQSRWLNSVNASDYAAFTSILQALAEEVDSEIANISPQPSNASIQLMQSICEGVLSNRLPTDTTFVSGIASQIVALWTQTLTGMNTVLVNPENQSQWYVKSDGDPTAQGDTIATAITPTKLRRRLLNACIGQNTTITCLGNIDILELIGVSLQDNFTLDIEGTLTQVGAGSIVAVTPNASTGAAPWALQTTGIDWTAVTAKRIELSNGTVGWVGQVIDANNVRVSTFNGETSLSNHTPVALDTFTVSSLSTVTVVNIDVYSHRDNPIIFVPIANTKVRIRNLDINGGSNYTSTWETAQLWGCRIRNSRTQSTINTIYRSCFRDTMNAQEFISRDDSYLLVVDGCLIQDSSGVGQFWVPAGLSSWFHGIPWTRQTDVFLQSSIFLEVLSKMHCEQFSSAAFFLAAATMIQFADVVSGSSNIGASIGLGVTAAQTILYANGKKPTVTGNAGDTRVGTILTAYAGIPFINPNNHAKIVVG